MNLTIWTGPPFCHRSVNARLRHLHKGPEHLALRQMQFQHLAPGPSMVRDLLTFAHFHFQPGNHTGAEL